jgi:hypothetical protein
MLKKVMVCGGTIQTLFGNPLFLRKVEQKIR